MRKDKGVVLVMAWCKRKMALEQDGVNHGVDCALACRIGGEPVHEEPRPHHGHNTSPND